MQEKVATSTPAFDGAVWSCPMSKLMDAYKAAWDADRMPLLIDCYTPLRHPYYKPYCTPYCTPYPTPDCTLLHPLLQSLLQSLLRP